MKREAWTIVRRAIKHLPSDAAYLAAMRGLARLGGGGRMAMAPSGGTVVLDGRHHVASARRLPFYVQGLEHRAKRLTDDYLLGHIRFEPGDVAIDCGANVGDLLLSLDATGVPLRYVAFEPGKTEFACLQRNVAQFPQHTAVLHQKALGERDGFATFHANSEDGDGSILEIARATGKTEVEMVRLDSLPIGRVKLLKLEAEGYEPEVLEGATGALDRIEYIAADVGFERGLRCESTLPAVTNFLLERGFSIVANAKDRLVLLFRNTRFA